MGDKLFKSDEGILLWTGGDSLLRWRKSVCDDGAGVWRRERMDLGEWAAINLGKDRGHVEPTSVLNVGT